MPACRPLCLALLAVVAAGCTTSVQTERREAAAPTGDARPRADLANGALATQRSMDLAREQRAEAASISLSGRSVPPAPMAPPAQPLATAAVSLGRMPPGGPGEAANRENYAAHGVNPVQRTAEAPVSLDLGQGTGGGGHYGAKGDFLGVTGARAELQQRHGDVRGSVGHAAPHASNERMSGIGTFAGHRPRRTSTLTVFTWAAIHTASRSSRVSLLP